MAKKTLALILPGIYLLLSAYLIATQGLFGESFIAILLGIPWSFMLAFFEYGGDPSTPMLYVLVLGPIALNAIILYFIGTLFGWKK